MFRRNVLSPILTVKADKTPFIFKIQGVQGSFTLHIEGTNFFETAEATR